MRHSIRLLIAVLFCVAVYAQTDANKGQITGTVLDPNQAVVPNAKVTIKSTATGAVREATANNEGQFRAVLLDPGQYDVTVEAPGFAPSVFKGVEVHVGSSVTLPVNLQVGSVTTTVEVGGSLAGVDMPAPTTVINTSAIRDLPINGRRFQDFATMTPTVQIDSQRGSISFAAQRGINGNVMVDGTDYNNPFFGGTRGGERSGYIPTIPQSAIEEFQSITTGYSAEYGRSTGGVLNAISKSGSNEYHGESFYQIRHKETGLKTPFNKQILETLQQFGGGVGGPIKKDKLFFYAAAERQLSKTPRQAFFSTLVGLTPTAQQSDAFNYFKSLEGPIPMTNDATTASGRLDYGFNNGSRLTARFNFSDGTAQNSITSGAIPPPLENRALQTSGNENDRTYTGTAQWTAILSPTMANDLRFSGTHEDRPRTANALLPGVTNTIGTFGTRNFLPTVQDDTRYQFNDGFSINRGSHNFKFGGDYNYLTTFQSFGFNQFGTFTFTTSTVTTLLKAMSVATGQHRFDDSSVQYNRQIGNLLADYHMHQIAFYAQDNWRVNSRLQLNYGFRWEGQVNPQAVATNTAVVSAIQATTLGYGSKFDPSTLHNNLNQWMPRVGLTFTPVKGSSKTVIRAHAGLFYAASPMLIYGGSNNNFRATPGDVSLVLNPVGSNTVYQAFKQAGLDLDTYTLDKLPIIPMATVQAAAAVLAGTTPDPFRLASFTGTANDYANPRAFQIGVGADREITKNWVLSAQFNYINTVHLERNRDYNIFRPTVRAVDGRPIFTRSNRPLTNYGTITLRESSARSMYRGMVLSTRYRAGRFQFGGNYTVAGAYSDDDNERSSGGYVYDNPFNLKADYGFANLDIRHQVAGFGLVQLPWGIELSTTARFRTGTPIDPLAGSDLNADSSNSDRAYSAVGVEMKRNSFRNLGFKDVDVRFLKSFKLGERVRLQFSTEMFNLFNWANINYSGANLNYGPGVDPTTGAITAARVTFMRLKLADGTYDATNIQLGNPFQAQFGLRLFF